MRTNKFNIALKASFPNIGKAKLLVFLFFLITQISFAQPDKQVFDLNDPRNPDCPCHKYQKMADEEFEKLQKKNKKYKLIEIAEVEDTKELNVKEEQIKDLESPTGLTNTTYPKKQKRKIIKRRIHKRVNLFTLRSIKTKKFKPRYSVCFKW